MPSCFRAICGAFQISAPRSVKLEASVVWNRNDGDPDDSVFARRLLPAEVGDQLPESPGSLLSGTIDVEFPIPGIYLIEIRTPQPEFRLLAESDTITAETDASDSDTSESAIATSSIISSTVPVPVPRYKLARCNHVPSDNLVQLLNYKECSVAEVQVMPDSITTVSESSLQPTSTDADVTVFIVNTVTESSSSLSTPLATVAQGPVNAGTSNQITSASTSVSSTKVSTSTSTTNIPLFISSDPNLGTIRYYIIVDCSDSIVNQLHSTLESTSVSTTLSGRLVTGTTHTSTYLSTPTTPTTPTSPISSVSSRSHVPQIIGGTLGSFLSIILLTVLFIFYRWRRLRRPSSQSLDIEKRKESETRSPESMDQPLTKPESHASMLTSAYSPRISQRTFYLSYTDGFLRRLDSDPHRHERDFSIASSGISPHLTSRQFLLHERAGSLRDEADWLRQTVSSTPPNDRIVGELQATIWRLEEHVQRLEAEHESDWALHQSDEPPPVYMEVISRTQSNS
ncbi:hypothetical protein F5146DRAFT_1157241 [Armillaria mellea]|nr:hypothetical protein F5146DRAFT_1157241 [Armillaria mellea]